MGSRKSSLPIGKGQNIEANRTLPAPIRQAVEEALSARFGGSVGLVGVQHFWPACVFRCTLHSSSSVAPATVIVRIPREGAARSGPTGFQNEQAALAYLAGIGSSLAPRFLAGGSAAGFLVMEDLGSDPSLLDLLLGADPEAARQGLLAFARGLGRLHAQTAGRSEGLHLVHVPVAAHWQQVKDAVAQLALPAPTGVDDDVATITRLLAEPGDCLALSSGDPSVVNCKIGNGNVRFFDFEAACFRHALVDAVVLRYPYPAGGPPWHLPCDIAIESESVYRAELAQVCSVAQDDSRYQRCMAAACAAWTILRLARLPKVDAGPDRDPWLLLPSGWAGPIPTRSRRRQLAAILETCLASARRADAFATLTSWLERLTDSLRERWPEATEALPLYPAFRQILDARR